MRKKYVYLVHGFNVKDKGAATTDRLRPFFEEAGYVVKEFDYLWTGLLRVRLCNANFAHTLSRMVEPGSIAVGHSNGCAIIHLACHANAPLSQVVYINPALNRFAKLAAHIKAAHVWHSPSDKIVKLSSLIPKHSWGRMGAAGYRGTDKRYHNYNKEHDWHMASKSHSDVFKEPLLGYFGPKIVGKVQERAHLLRA